MISAVKAGKNVIVARTFSKLYGFAGLRVGYLLAQPDMVMKLSMYTEGPNSLSTTSLHAAMASYQDRDFLDGALAKTIASKKYLYDVLKKEGYDYVPSSTNFVLFPVKMDARQFVMEMNKRGVGVRSWQFNNKNWCRVSIGRMDEMQAFASAFKEIS
jgi:histidinol-phosphate aminotransferase